MKTELNQQPSKDEKDLYRVMVVSTALSFGFLAAFLYSLKDIPDDPTFVFGLGSIAAFFLGAFSGWLFWRGVRVLVKKRAESNRDQSNHAKGLD